MGFGSRSVATSRLSLGGGSTAAVAAGTKYVPLTGLLAANATEAIVTCPCPVDGRVVGFFIVNTGAAAAGSAAVFTLRVNGIDSTVTATCPASAAAGTVTSDLVHTPTVVQGNKLTVKYVEAATTSNSAFMVLLLLEPA